MEVQRAYALAHLVDRAALSAAQEANDALLAATILKRAFRTDAEPILAMARRDKGAAIDPVAAYRASGYRARVAEERPAVRGGSGGIV
jgi:L-rhamnose isomerase/sugar isomerase